MDGMKCMKAGMKNMAVINTALVILSLVAGIWMDCYMI